MKQDTRKTKVHFLVNEKPDFDGEKNSDVFAYFPDEIADGQYNKLCYAHIGQHSACSPEYAKESQNATPQEYSDLKTELESIGYNLTVIN